MEKKQEEKQYRCNYCGEAFFKPLEKAQHVRLSHTNELRKLKEEREQISKNEVLETIGKLRILESILTSWKKETIKDAIDILVKFAKKY